MVEVVLVEPLGSVLVGTEVLLVDVDVDVDDLEAVVDVVLPFLEVLPTCTGGAVVVVVVGVELGAGVPSTCCACVIACAIM